MPEKRISEVITLILGGLGTLMLLSITISLAKNNSGFAPLAGLLVLFYQAIISIIALPFLIKSFKRVEIVPWFATIVVGESILNSIFSLLQITYFPGIEQNIIIFFVVVGILQLIPVLFYVLNKDKII